MLTLGTGTEEPKQWWPKKCRLGVGSEISSCWLWQEIVNYELEFFWMLLYSYSSHCCSSSAGFWISANEAVASGWMDLFNMLQKEPALEGHTCNIYYFRCCLLFSPSSKHWARAHLLLLLCAPSLLTAVFSIPKQQFCCPSQLYAVQAIRHFINQFPSLLIAHPASSCRPSEMWYKNHWSCNVTMSWNEAFAIHQHSGPLITGRIKPVIFTLSAS